MMRYKYSFVLICLLATPVFAEDRKDITMNNKGGDVVFSHVAHVDGMKLACNDCHDKLYTNSKKHKKVSMKEMKSGQSCGFCHNGKKAFSVKNDCAKCHKKR
jgi:c(7)-type cytochrome triheme protein